MSGDPAAPNPPLAVAFIDGQNLFHCAKEAFGYTYPNFDPRKLAEAVCARAGWTLSQTRFYSGIPTIVRDPKWHAFWTKKLQRMSRSGVVVETRPLRYTEELLDDGTYRYIPREKGIDVRIAIDVIRFALGRHCDVALIFSQDQDLAEVAKEVRDIARRGGFWFKIASAYPDGGGTIKPRGINGTDWLSMDQVFYDTAIDPNNYF